MPEIVFKGKEYVYNHHLTVPYRPLVPYAEKGIGPAAFRSDVARYKNPEDDSRGAWLLCDLAARNQHTQGLYPITTPSGRVLDGPPHLDAGFAGHLDEQAALRWWHRNVGKTQYGLQGWRRHKVYPAFVEPAFLPSHLRPAPGEQHRDFMPSGPAPLHHRLVLTRGVRAASTAGVIASAAACAVASL